MASTTALLRKIEAALAVQGAMLEALCEDAGITVNAIGEVAEPGPTRAELKAMSAVRLAKASGEAIDPEIDASGPARELAEKEGIDLASLTGSGAGGKITVTDVKAAIEASG